MAGGQPEPTGHGRRKAVSPLPSVIPKPPGAALGGLSLATRAVSTIVMHVLRIGGLLFPSPSTLLIFSLVLPALPSTGNAQQTDTTRTDTTRTDTTRVTQLK